jgi:hypothetical protein
MMPCLLRVFSKRDHRSRLPRQRPALGFRSRQAGEILAKRQIYETTIRSILTLLAFLCLTLGAPKAQAVVPPPDGGYPNFNTAEGQNALLSLTTGAANTAVGWFSLFSNTEGSFNTATGAGALLFNNGDPAAFEASDNTAFGAAALLFNTTGFDNTAVGAAALLYNTEGDFNTANGRFALQNNTTGSSNTAIGADALFSSTGNSNTALGSNAGNNVTTANGVICISALGENVSNSCYIGNIYNSGQPIVGTDPDSVTITSTGRLGRGNVSSRRYKHEIQPMDRPAKRSTRSSRLVFGTTRNTMQRRGLRLG